MGLYLCVKLFVGSSTGNLLVDKESRLPSLNAIKIPNGINDLEVRNKLLNDYKHMLEFVKIG